MTDGLVAFLRARLDEDYEAARLTLDVNAMTAYKRGKPLPRWVPSPEGDASIWDTDGTPRVKFVWAREMDHIIRHDPARVVAEVAAKRLIVDQSAYWERQAGGNIAALTNTERAQRHTWLAACRMLAAVYADHPDYREEWRP
ncbi:DUF6221 family protein [Actinacidiphila glaucinigra]|uniref:DUF6221 family protein n=1 Tax=Actinacidiphila glaucinigra TaxID=235986 RepID=UPI00324D3E53